MVKQNWSSSTTPKPTNLLEEEEEGRNQKTSDMYRFLFSGLTVQEKIEYGAVVERLGGIVYDVQYFNTECTHVICNAPSR